MQNNHALKNKSIAELEAELTSYEQAYAFGDIPKSEYLNAKTTLQNAIIDKQTGPLKRKVFQALEPFSNRLAKKEWVGFQAMLTGLRSVQAVREYYDQWRDILAFRKIADLPDLDQPKPKQINAAA